MLTPRPALGRLAVLALLGALLTLPIQAEALFESALCRLVGCAVVTNGDTWELYVFDPSSGGRARLWAASTGAQPVATVRPDTLGGLREPGAGEGTALGVDLDGDGTADLHMDTGADGGGFLDAGDRLPAFPVTTRTRLSLAEREIRHSFFVASNVPFAIHAEAALGDREGPLGDSLALSAVHLGIEASVQGIAGNLAFGGASTTAGLEADPSITHLGDLAAGRREVLRFTRPTATGSGDLLQQMVQLQLVYQLGGYDLSQGTGAFEARIEYSIEGF